MPLRPPFAAWKLNDTEMRDLEQIIEKAYKDRPNEDGQVNQEGQVNSEIRRSQIKFTQDRDLHAWIWDKFSRTNRQLFGFDIRDVFDMQYSEYHESYEGHYDWHTDTSPDVDNMYQRKLSMSIQLSAAHEYEGGNLEIGGVDLSDPKYKDKGTVVVFPSLMPHRVAPVTKGLRKSLVTWCEGLKSI
jgi:PKHD-type hydroxylase|tara:strand:- start:1935 stop:2492 length:558 start_codon:yes stop_codon:yes gene_type:complete